MTPARLVHAIRRRGVGPLVGSVVGLLALAGSAGAQEPAAGVLFPRPFLVEHHLEQRSADGDGFTGETVTDYYGGSWIVSVRPDGSRMIVDLARRELTEVQPASGTYWSIGFSRLGELRERLQRLDTPSLFAAEASAPAKAATEPPRPVVVEVPSATAKAASGDLAARPGVRHLRATVATPPGEKTAALGTRDDALDVWVDPSVRLTPAARRALAAFERDALALPAAAAAAELPVHELLAAVRDHADGAVPVRLRQPLAALPGEPSGGAYIEDVVTRLEPIDVLPRDLVTVPEGLRRRLHPHESAIELYERDAAVGLLPR